MIVPTIICRARSTLRALFRMAVPPVLSSTYAAGATYKALAILESSVHIIKSPEAGRLRGRVCAAGFKVERLPGTPVRLQETQQAQLLCESRRFHEFGKKKFNRRFRTWKIDLQNRALLALLAPPTS